MDQVEAALKASQSSREPVMAKKKESPILRPQCTTSQSASFYTKLTGNLSSDGQFSEKLVIRMFLSRTFVSISPLSYSYAASINFTLSKAPNKVQNILRQVPAFQTPWAQCYSGCLLIVPQFAANFRVSIYVKD